MENFTEDVLKKMLKEFLPEFSEDKKGENLLQIGITSIQIMSIASRLKAYGIKIPFFELAAKPVFNEWIKLTDKYHKSVGLNGEFEQLQYLNEFRMTDVQNAYWVGRNIKNNLGNVSCHVYLELDGYNVDAGRLQSAWKQLIKLHPMLRVCITKSKTQKILPYSKYDSLEVFDFKDKSEGDIKKHIEMIRKQRIKRKLNIEDGETAGLALTLFPKGRTKIHFDLDLIAADVMSFYIIMNDLYTLYNGKQPSFCGVWNYGEYLKKQMVENKDEIKEAKKFWKNKVKTMPTMPELPINTKALNSNDRNYIRNSHTISKDVWNRFEQSCALNKTTPAMTLLTIYAHALEKWSTNSEFLINVPIFNRDTSVSGIDKVVADFTNLVLVEVDFKKGETFSKREERIRKTFQRNFSNRAYSGIQVQKDIRDVKKGSALVAPVVYSYTLGNKLLSDECIKTFGNLGYMISQTPQVFIDFQIVEVGQEILFSFDFPVELFKKVVIDGIFNDMIHMFEQVLNTDGKWEFSLDDKVHFKMLKEYEYPINDKLLHQGFFEYEQKDPNKIALISADRSKYLTYSSLKEEALKTAELLKSSGVCAGDVVAVTLERSFEQIIAILGILAMGCYYVPVGVHLSYQRRNKIHGRCNIKYVLTDSKYKSELKFSDNIIIIDIAKRVRCKASVCYKYSDNKSYAYIIPTSGTTGEPRNVAISHYNAVNTIDAINSKYGISSKDTAITVSAIDFDLSVYDIFGILGVGGTLVILNEHNSKDNLAWIQAIIKNNVTVWNSVPILAKMLIMGVKSLLDEKLPLKVVMLSGDWIDVNLTKEIDENTINCKVAAMGGATECSIWSNLCQVEFPLKKDWATIPYGYALPGQMYRVVDNFGRDCRPYVKGELWIGGCGVSDGYVGDLEATKSKFVLYNNIRYYKTGDFGFIHEDGFIEFLGREDDQIKINGYRVELFEIKHAMLKLAYINDAVAIFDKDNNKIIAFYSGEKELKKEDILDVVRREIPEYMIPSTIIYLDQIPLTNNSKVDKQYLLKIAANYNENKICSEDNMSDSKIIIKLKELLNQKSVNMNKGFIANNGDSIQAMKLSIWLKEVMDIDISAFDILNLESLTELEEEINVQNKNMFLLSKVSGGENGNR